MAKRGRRDFYEILGVQRNADEKTIKAAYRKLARTYHPDITGDDAAATEQFKEITIAYETLSDQRRRKTYDLFGGDDAGSGDLPFDLDGALQSIKDIFQRDKAGPRPGVDLEIDVDVAFSDVWSGAKTPVRIVADRPCQTCSGSGAVDARKCAVCRGSGTRLTEDTLLVGVPAGADTGTRLRLRKRGAAGEHAGPAGDLYVRLNVKNDRRFARDDDTLLAEIRVPMTVAVTGGAADVTLPDDSVVKLSIPKGTRGGQVFRLRGKGFPRIGEKERSDLLVTVEIALPDPFPDDAIAALLALKERVPTL